MADRRPYLWLAGITWLLVGSGLLTMGGIFWFHFPATIFLDKQHILFGTLAVSVGILKGQYILDRSARKTIERLDASAATNPLSRLSDMFGWRQVLLIAAMIGLGVILRVCGVNAELRGLLYLAVGVGLLWGCRRYIATALTQSPVN
jgi:hypothetical protein